MKEETAVEWRDFTASSFTAAEDADIPVLLSIVTPWCRPCAAMDRDVYSDSAVAEAIHEDVVPIRVNGDTRPRIRDRYTMGGFPSTLFLTPDGTLISGATELDTDAFLDVSSRVREVWDDRGADAGRVPRSVRTDPPGGAVTRDIELRIAERLRDGFDPDHGGWGDGPKFPLPRTIEFALGRDPELATRTLDPIRQHLLDTVDGGFYRYAEGRDWSTPHREKLLDENAALLRAFANGYLHTGDDAYRKTAADLVDFLTATLWVGGAFAASQVPADPEYYRLEVSERTDRDGPEIDPTILADRNALAVDALLIYHAYTDNERAREYAERALETLEDLIDGGSVRRYPGDDAPQGTLLDQARVTGAFVTAAQVLDPAHLESARAVADHAIDNLLTQHGFLDGRDGPGLLDRPLYPIDVNAEMTDVLIDLSKITGDPRYQDAAHRAIAAFAGALERFGPEQAAYGTAASRVVDPPLRIEVSDTVGSDLHRAALRVADHEKIVVPACEGSPETATVFVGDEPGETVDDPETLVRHVEERIR